MRQIRTLAAGLGVLAMLPAAASAQSGRLFENSWFWGAKVGGLTFWTTRVQHAFAPLVGGEWLITRSRAALYLSADQSIFNEQSTVKDTLVAGGNRTVNISDNRRYTMALLAFPRSVLGFRAYGGLGFSFNIIQTATATGTFASQAQADTINLAVENQRSRVSPVFIGGMQAQYQRFSIFGQASMMQTRGNFLFNNNGNSYVMEAGVRWNMGSAVERPR
jgi:hypothetical protein